MTTEQSVSWIFLSIAVASEIRPASFEEITMIGDGINHAVPTHKELQTSISWLTKRGLVLKRGKKYELSKKGKMEFENVSDKNAEYLKMMEKLELYFRTL
jgi:predicted transcriptional regulator